MLRIPIDYASILRNRVLIITGAGRSGTTILGKVIGSMEPTVYLFEPAVMKYFTRLPGFPGARRELAEAFYGTIVEDYLFPRLQGRRADQPSDDSWIGHYFNPKRDLRRHSDTLAYVRDISPLFVIKSNELATSLTAAPLFLGQKVLHIVRNGLHVVASALERDWYTDEWCKTQIDWAEQNGTPWWVGKEARELWPGWTPLTRAAHCWRKLVSDADVIPGVKRISYEEFCGVPRGFVGLFEEWYGLRRTELTENHCKGIKWRQRSQPSVDDIQLPEREKFREKMEQLRYL